MGRSTHLPAPRGGRPAREASSPGGESQPPIAHRRTSRLLNDEQEGPQEGPQRQVPPAGARGRQPDGRCGGGTDPDPPPLAGAGGGGSGGPNPGGNFPP